MNEIEVLKHLKALIDRETSLTEIARKEKLSRPALWRSFKQSTFSLDRFLLMLPHVNRTPAEFFAELEDKTIMDGNLLVLEFQLKSAELKIQMLEKQLEACKQSKKKD